MAKKKTENINHDENPENIEITGGGITVDEQITYTLRENYMPYAMSVIVSRALPEIDGFKPSHRKLLYTMYNMGLLSGARMKSANVVGQTMKLNPHGDAAIYDTMVRLSRGNETLLHPYVDSKGNFGKSYSRDMMYAASRYTEVKLAAICEELFADIGKETVDFVDNYDSTMKEPTLFPTRFPSILVNSNIGIAVGMASAICPFNLAEVCETTARLVKDPQHDVISTLKAPDFRTGGYLIYDEKTTRQIYETGRGSFRVRSKYDYDDGDHCLEITEIPPSTTVEAIIDKIVELMKVGKLREISAVRDESDKKGLRLAIDVKRGNDPEKLMTKLFRLTPLEDNFACNFTLLVHGTPRLMGVRDILLEWIEFRRDCIIRRTKFDLSGKQQRLHLLEALAKILLDIDKAIKIVRDTEQERDVVPNLMIGFGIDETQANYIAEIKLRHLNREYILNRLAEKDQLNADIDELNSVLGSKTAVDKIIIHEQADVAKKYAQARLTKIIYDKPEEFSAEPEKLSDYPVTVFFTRDGYFKKITPASLRMSGEQKLKDGDEIIETIECKNDANLLFFTNQHQAYKCHVADFADSKASVIGDYVAAQLGMDEGETAIALVVSADYAGHVVMFYENGKAARVPLSTFETKLNRRKLSNAYSRKQALVAIKAAPQPTEFAVFSSGGRLLMLNSDFISEKQAKDALGVAVMTLKKGAVVTKVALADTLPLENIHRFRARNLPASGGILREDDLSEQLRL